MLLVDADKNIFESYFGNVGLYPCCVVIIVCSNFTLTNEDWCVCERDDIDALDQFYWVQRGHR